MELPKLEKGVLFIGNSSLSLHGCSLDTLIYYFGDPDTYYYLDDDSRFVIFRFPHELGYLLAFVFFQDPDCPVILDPDDFIPGLDRGNLVELQFELDEPLAFKRLGRVRYKLENKGFQFAVFSGKMIGRILTKGKINALSFLNSHAVDKPEKSFMCRRVFWLDSSLNISFQLWLEREAERRKHKKGALKN